MAIPETTPASAPSQPPPPRPAMGVFALGSVLLLAATAAAGVLTFQQISGLSIPGCGIGSPCARAAGSVYGKVPGIHWPVSFLGLAYFAGLLASWTRQRGRWGAGMRTVAALGGVVSLGYIGIMLAERLLCPWCLASHAANLAFVALALTAGRRGSPGAPAGAGLVAAAVVAMFATGAIVGTEGRARDAAKARAAKELEASMQKVLDPKAQAKAETKAEPKPADTAEAPAAKTPETPAATPPSAAANPGQTVTPPAQAAAFTGRYRLGPEKAKIRIVMFTGFQCADCKRIEAQARELVKARQDISLSIKHFPLTAACNPHMKGQTIHPNGCWAARAAEAAGLIAGNDGFWKMTEWLFERGGGFTDAELDQGLDALGFTDRRRFKDLMKAPATLARVQADVEEGIRLGLTQTPLIFINGIEFRGWNVGPDAMMITMHKLANANLPLEGPENDRPPLAAEKFIEDWKTSPNMAWPTRRVNWLAGTPESPVQIQVWGDYLNPSSAELDRRLRALTDGREDVRYQFRYFPLDRACNESIPQTFHAGACLPVRAVEAAGRLGGAPAYWALHRWILDNQATFSEETLMAHAPTLGLNPAALKITMDSPEVAKALADDVETGRRVQLPMIPRLYVNGRVVERWDVPGMMVLERVLEEAPAHPEPR